MTFSLAAASRSLSKLLPHAAPVTYGILGLTSLLYVVSLLATMRRTGFAPPGGGLLGMLFGLGGISDVILIRMGESLPAVYNLQQPWRLVTAVFLHGSLLHIGFNMWALMNVGSHRGRDVRLGALPFHLHRDRRLRISSPAQRSETTASGRRERCWAWSACCWR